MRQLRSWAMGLDDKAARESVEAKKRGECALGCFHELDHIWMPNGRFEGRHDHLERLGRCHAEPFNLDPSDRHVFLPLIEAIHAKTTSVI
jgi:hypothetical protein